MKYKNKLADKPLRFMLGSKWFEVEPGGVVDVPDKYDYSVAAMGVLVEPYVESTPAPAASPTKKQKQQ